VSNQKAFVSSNSSGRNIGRSDLLKYQSGHKQGKLHYKSHSVRVTRYPCGSWQWMVVCTQRSDLWYPVQNALNSTVREKNWVSRWSTPTWGGKCILSFDVSLSCKLKKLVVKMDFDQLWMIDTQWEFCSWGVTLKHECLGLVCKLWIWKDYQDIFQFLWEDLSLFRISRTRFILRG